MQYVTEKGSTVKIIASGKLSTKQPNIFKKNYRLFKNIQINNSNEFPSKKLRKLINNKKL